MRALLPACLSLLLSACVLSIEPIVSDDEKLFDPRLLGEWVSGSDRAVISRGSDSTYAIEYTSDGDVGQFEARLGRLGEHTVLDLAPAEDRQEPDAGLQVRGHLLFTLDIGSDEIRVAALEHDSVLSAVKDGRIRLEHTKADEQIILHGMTEELRSALRPHLESMVTETNVWRRAEDAAAPSKPVEPPCFEASAWREADVLFREDAHWVGGDGTSSVDLGDGRILWLFSDSWIDPSGLGTRANATIASNTVAIQTGSNPARASIKFYWGGSSHPEAFIANADDERHWFGDGVLVHDRLVLFLARIRSTDTGIGFEAVGWAAWMVENPDAEPSAWRMRRLPTPENPLGVLVGFASVMRMGEFVYAFGSQDPVKSHPIYAVRWSAEEVGRGNLLQPEWWSARGWVPDSSSTPRWPLFENGQAGMTIHGETGRFLAVQTQGFGPADLMMRAAPVLTGPWSEPRMIYRPPEYYRTNVILYSARAHPELTGADLVLTYDTNTFEFAEHLTDSLIYYPRFVRLTACR